MDKIVVIDNFLTKDELNNCKTITETIKWDFGYASTKSTDDTDITFWNSELIDNEYLSIYILKIIEKCLSTKFKIKRLYANGQSFGQDGSYHYDDLHPNCYTFCLYLTDIAKEYIDIAGGYIYFSLPEHLHKICYEPKYNRGIFFPSHYIHKANAFSRYIFDLRVVIVWKLEEIIDKKI